MEVKHVRGKGSIGICRWYNIRRDLEIRREEWGRDNVSVKRLKIQAILRDGRAHSRNSHKREA